jgi:hypothetical protein
MARRHDATHEALEPAGYDDRVSDTTPIPTTVPADDAAAVPPHPGERRLAHPPSDRYRAAEIRATTPPAPDPAASIPRGLAVAAVAAILGAGAIVLLGGILTLSTGLLVVAGATGLGVGLGLRFGAGDALSRRRRVAWAVALSVAAIALGQLGLWQYARTEGGVLPPLEYLGEVFGPLVPLEFATAAVVAWLAAR